VNILRPKIFDNFPEISAGLSLIDSSLPDLGSMPANKTSSNPELMANRSRLAIELGADAFHVASPRITFTDRVVGVDEALRREDADAIVTDKKGWACMTTMADCFPVLAYDPVKKVVGSMHNGWPNSEKNLAKNFVNYLVENYQTNPADLVVWIGPGLARDSFEVTEEFLSKFDSKYFTQKNNTHWLFDHRAVINDQFTHAGVTQAENLDTDTKTDERFFSYRRQGQVAGRMGAVIMLVQQNSVTGRENLAILNPSNDSQ
jgi:polyphenol oxidase